MVQSVCCVIDSVDLSCIITYLITSWQDHVRLMTKSTAIAANCSLVLDVVAPCVLSAGAPALTQVRTHSCGVSLHLNVNSHLFRS